MSAYPPPPHDIHPPLTAGQYVVEPHRGSMILTLGILGICVCFICGIIAWVLGTRDLKKINAGTMDARGRGLTQAGQIIGIVSTCLGALVIAIWLLWIIIVVFIMGAAAVAGSNAAPGAAPAPWSQPPASTPTSPGSYR